MGAIWAAGGSVLMIEIGDLVREEAQLAEGATIDAIGKRSDHQLSSLSGHLLLQARATYRTSCEASPARRAKILPSIDAHFLTLLHAAAGEGKTRALNPRDYKTSV